MMEKTIQNEIEKHGHKSRIIPLERLRTLKQDIDRFSDGEVLTPFQEYILGSMYRYGPESSDWNPESIVVIAVPHPAYARVEFAWQGKHLHTACLAVSFGRGENAFSTTERYLKRLGDEKNFHVVPASDLPLKRLAAASGLAVYGRNNICYVEGMGSFFTLVAYFTDVPCEQDKWRPITVAKACTGCTECFDACPTGAIRRERFLLNCEHCLSYMNEQPGEFPEWLPAEVHHCVYDCLKCQLACPMNADYVHNVTGPFRFSEDETQLLVDGKQMQDMSPDLQKKVRLLGMDSWLGAVPRNLKMLFALQER